MLLRARLVLPISRPPIVDGVVLISGHRIQAVGPWADLKSASGAPVIDLGEVALLPGLVNAHCHLDYTDMAGKIPPTRLFTDWIKTITSFKAQWSYSEFAQSWLRGARMLVRHGTTTVADIECAPELLPDVRPATPLRVHSFLEMTGVKSRRAPSKILQQAIDTIGSLPSGRGGAGLSPHAPYSTTPELLRLTALAARLRRWRLTTHVAESELEFEMFMRAKGDMYEWLKRNHRDMSDCGLGSPVQHLARHGMLSKNVLAVHVNYLAQGDAALLAKNQAHVAHCPRSHAYFRHQRFPLETLRTAGVNICLGTDSLASANKTGRQVPELNLFAEMRALTKSHPELAPEWVLQMATIHGARALGMQDKIGELKPGCFADLIAVPCPGKSENVVEAVVHHPGGVAASMIDGEWVIPPGS